MFIKSRTALLYSFMLIVHYTKLCCGEGYYLRDYLCVPTMVLFRGHIRTVWARCCHVICDTIDKMKVSYLFCVQWEKLCLKQMCDNIKTMISILIQNYGRSYEVLYQFFSFKTMHLILFFLWFFNLKWRETMTSYSTMYTTGTLFYFRFISYITKRDSWAYV